MPVFTALRDALPAWIDLGVSAWVEDMIAGGVRIEWDSPPTPYRSHDYPLDAADSALMTPEIERGLAACYIQEMNDSTALDQFVCVSSSLVVHSGQNPRVVFDYKHPNTFQAVSS